MTRTLLLASLVAFASGCGGEGAPPNYDHPLRVNESPRPFRGTGPALENTKTHPEAPSRTNHASHPVDAIRPSEGNNPGGGNTDGGDPDFDCWEFCEGNETCIDLFCED